MNAQSPGRPATKASHANLPATAPALWQQLSACTQAVMGVRRGQSLNDALAACPGPLRPGVQALSFQVMRQMGLADALASLLVAKPPAPWVEALIVSALALAQSDAYPAHTLVNQAVEACKRGSKSQQAASNFVNAVLRRYLREQATLLATAQAHPRAQHNHPEWWVKRLQQDWPDQWPALLAHNQHAAPMSLRVNRRQGDRTTYLQALQTAGVLPSDAPADLTRAISDPAWQAWLDDSAIVLPKAVPVGQLPGFDQGACSVQDVAAQLAAHLLVHGPSEASQGWQLAPGARVLDACAAPGGKTAHLLELADLDVLALDSNAERLKRVQDTVGRLGLHARQQSADASRPADWWDGQLFDAILLDAPCSASGIVRRHPDVRWLRRDSDIAALAATQDALLDALWPLLKPGGRLLYCTCSLFKAEGQDRIDAFLQRQPRARLLASPGHMLPVVEYPDAPAASGADRGDGFFYALLTS
jgi:16S rRNA (cytosine967-C5)-methyltransferase